jgi:hypothetical protein
MKLSILSYEIIKPYNAKTSLTLPNIYVSVFQNMGLTGFDSWANGYVSMQAHATTA